MDTIKITAYNLHFKQPAQTSRSILRHRKVYFVEAWDHQRPEVRGWGEIAPLDGLSPEGADFHHRMSEFTHSNHPISSLKKLTDYPAVRFGLEAAALDLANGGKRIWFQGGFVHGSKPIAINGLIWMGDKASMFSQIKEKLKNGYPCLKLKIGGIDFEEEVSLLRFIRSEFSTKDLELRLDANGSFDPNDATEKLKRLSAFDIHSIEQPIAPGQQDTMARLCSENIIPIALDEELIGIKSPLEKEQLLKTIQPHYLIFKPSLIGGIVETDQYIALCKKQKTGWWITSALESNVGLNILAQYCYSLGVDQVQGLGTGKLFTNNIKSPLREEKGLVLANPNGTWAELPS